MLHLICRGICSSVLAVFMSLCVFTPPVMAYNQPPVNVGSTTFIDGGGGPPGFYWISYIQFTQGEEAVDDNGDVIPGDGSVNSLVNLNQFYYLSKLKFLGADVGFDFLVPVVALTAKGNLGPAPITANTAGLGDVIVGMALQWRSTLMGKPFFHRAELDVNLPTGKYDQSYMINPGSNLVTVEPYYAFTWLFAKKWETSWRLMYDIHGENGDTEVKPGHLFHANGALGYEVHPKLSLGAVGYYYQQITKDEVAGVKQVDAKERAMAVGPGLHYKGEALMIMLSYPIEFGVQNRFKGSRATLQIIYRF